LDRVDEEPSRRWSSSGDCQIFGKRQDNLIMNCQLFHQKFVSIFVEKCQF
jgi:hypothetical protein